MLQFMLISGTWPFSNTCCCCLLSSSSTTLQLSKMLPNDVIASAFHKAEHKRAESVSSQSSVVLSNRSVNGKDDDLETQRKEKGENVSVCGLCNLGFVFLLLVFFLFKI